MNELVITPNFEKKSAKIRGRCAAGEHVLVRLVDMAGLPAETLRLCIMLRERLFAVFPLAIEDSAAEWTVDGGDLTCVLNLNTEPLVKFARCGALTLEFILDDPSNHILYFSEMHQVQPWHSLRASGDDAQPRDMPPFDGVVISTKTLGDLREAVRRLAEKGGAKIISSVAVALLAVCGAFAATVQTVPLNDLDYDVNPPVVTNVTFEGLADATNVYTKAETEEKIVELAPAPGNYAAVSNAAMSAKTKLSAIFNMDNPTAVPKAVEAQESESASFASEANKAYNLFAEGEEPESRSSIDIFAAIDAALRKDKQNNEVQIFGGLLSGFGFYADTGHNDNGWNQYMAHNGNALAQSLPAYIESNPWGFLKLDGDNVLTVPTLTVGARAGGSVIGERSVAEGYEVTASGTTSHAEGDSTTAYGGSAHAEGELSTAWGPHSHAEGYDTQTQNSGEHAQGRCNLSHTGANAADQTISSIGIGGGNRDRKNAVETMRDGKTFIYGLGGYDGTNPTNGVKDLATAIEGKANAADIPEWAKAPAKPTYTASEVGALGNTGEQTIVGESSDHPYFRIGFDAAWPWLEFGEFNGAKRVYSPHTSGTLAVLSDIAVKSVKLNGTALTPDADGAVDVQAATPDNIPPAVSNIVTTALVRERLGVYLYVGADGGIYVHTNEE